MTGQQVMMPDDADAPSVGAPMPGEPETAARPPEVGSREHVRQALDRLVATRAGAGRGHAPRERLLALAGSPPDWPAGADAPPLSPWAQLGASVTAYALQLRGDGVPSERMLLLLKSVVREVTPPQIEADEARALMEQVVRWSIEAYFGTV